jgi:hypothetical protein
MEKTMPVTTHRPEIADEARRWSTLQRGVLEVLAKLSAPTTAQTSGPVTTLASPSFTVSDLLVAIQELDGIKRHPSRVILERYLVRFERDGLVVRVKQRRTTSDGRPFETSAFRNTMQCNDVLNSVGAQQVVVGRRILDVVSELLGHGMAPLRV